jgi:hypothetical protein
MRIRGFGMEISCTSLATSRLSVTLADAAISLAFR